MNLGMRLELPSIQHSLRPCSYKEPIWPMPMTSDQAAQLIDDTLDLVHQRLQDLQARRLQAEQRALAEEFREWRHPTGSHIDLMVFPGLANS